LSPLHCHVGNAARIRPGDRRQAEPPLAQQAGDNVKYIDNVNYMVVAGALGAIDHEARMPHRNLVRGASQDVCDMVGTHTVQSRVSVAAITQ
jgi:hypothetical protein